MADTVMKKSTLSVFAAPYFKDVNFFSHPDNPDTERKKCSDELDVYLQNPREWTRVDKRKLTQVCPSQRFLHVSLFISFQRSISREINDLSQGKA